MKKSTWVIISLLILLIMSGSISVYFILDNKKVESHQLSPKVAKQLWTCTMHPQVIADKPGQCPICGMDLVKKISDDNSKQIDMKNMIKLTDNKLAMANVSTVRVTREPMIKQVVAYSYLEFADQNRKVITARFNGRIEKLFVNKTGENITKGEALFEIYSPDLVQAQNEFLIALNSGKNANPLLNSARKKLQIFGFTNEQIKNLETKKEVQLTMTYYSPSSGTVIEKKVQEGMYINEGMALFDIADLSTLWNISEIYETDLNVVNLGSQVKLTLQSYPGKVFQGRVTLIYPIVNSQTRTIKIRSEFANTNGKFRSQMFGETTFERNLGYGIVVPSDAILFMGKRNVVWVKTADSMFEPKEVTVGMKIGDNYQILEGINEGDEVAVTGGFLIDSESQLKSGMVTGHQHSEKSKKPSKDNSMPGMPGM